MKITIDVDITPEELRQFIGLPNVEKLQQEMLDHAQQYLKETGQSQYQELIANAMQPMMAYQSWLKKMMETGKDNESNG